MSDVAERNHVRDLLDCVDIETVYSVDDRYAPDRELVTTIGRGLSPEQRADLLRRPGEEASYAEFAVFRIHLEELWAQYGEAEQTSLVQRAQQMVGATRVADDTVTLDMLGELLADRLEKLSRAAWTARQEEILGTGKPVLVLFDRDFSPEGGGATEGEDLIREVQQRSLDKPVWTGLLTHTVRPEDEHETYLNLGAEGIDLQRMVVISKARVTREEFPAHLRLTLLARVLHRLVTRVAEKLTETYQAAVEETKEVLPVELESMVFGASEVEGVWPPETLLLLFGLIQRDVARVKIWDDEKVRDLTEKVQCLGAVRAGLPVADRAASADAEREDGADEGQARPAPRFYQQKQIYADTGMVNKQHLPIECGDVFCSTKAPSKRWVVIAQPCDLALRSDGRRGEFETTHVVLAPIKKLKDKDKLQEGDFKLPYFEDNGQPVVAQLNRARFQRLWLLDLAVFDAEGRARLDASQMDPPAQLLGGWRLRYVQLRQTAEEILTLTRRNDQELAAGLQLDPPTEAETIEELSTETRRAIVTDHTEPPFTTTLEPAASVLDAGCQRIRRLTDEYARALLTRWGAHLSRPVLPYDFTRQPKV